MYFNYETRRLLIRILNADNAPDVLAFLIKNRQDFEPFESAKVPAYYTTEYQAANLQGEFSACLARKYIRFYVFTKDNPNRIIGTISFSHFRELPYSDAIIGYKFDHDYQGMGYAFEAIDYCLGIVFSDFHLHRIEAMIKPDNERSIRLIRKLGFDYEGTAHQSILINGAWEDHERFSLINPVE